MTMNMQSLTLFTLTLIGLSTTPVWAERTWTDRAGTQKVEATLLDFNDDKVWLRRDDNRAFAIRLEQLSESDRAHVGQLARRRAKQMAAQGEPGPGQTRYGPPRKLGQLKNPLIAEGSGIARSGRSKGLLFTHNDSGGEPVVYAMDLKGRDLGSYVLRGVRAFDWEDMASFTFEKKHYLLIADVGNNGLGAPVQMLYVVEEPVLDPANPPRGQVIDVGRTIFFSYEDDHRDCEAIAIDPTDRTILLATKQREVESHVYAIRWPEKASNRAILARKLVTLKIPPVTAMDVSPDGRRAILLTYSHAYEYRRADGEDWAVAFSRPGRMIAMPLREQGESICYGADGRTLYLSSEQLPAPLWEVPIKGQ